MKLGTFIVATLCSVASSAALAAPDHAGAIEQYRQAYEASRDPHMLTLIADEYRAAGNAREALDYYCSYMYVAASGDDADHASDSARELAVSLGRSGATDHEACNPKKGAAKPVTGVAALDLNIPPPPASITKREIVGLSLLGVGVGSLGMALYEGRELAHVRQAQAANDPTSDAASLAKEASDHTRNQRLWLLSGGVTLVTGGVLWAIGRHDRKQQDARALSIAPTASKNGGGLVVGGAF